MRQVRRRWVGRLTRRRFSGEPTSAIYGTILAAGLLVGHGAQLGTAASLEALAVTLAVFWIAHAYTDVLGAGAKTGSPLTLAGCRHALRVQWPIVEAGIPPAVALVLAVSAGASVDAAVLAALAVSTVDLLGWGALAARRMGLAARQAVPYTAVAGLLGLGIVALKVAIH